MNKKNYFTIFLLIAVVSSGFAQNWFTNFDKAKEVASNNNQNIVLVFQGSDWCAPCIKLDKQVFSTKEFQKLASNHFIMLKADFPSVMITPLSLPQMHIISMILEKAQPLF